MRLFDVFWRDLGLLHVLKRSLEGFVLPLRLEGSEVFPKLDHLILVQGLELLEDGVEKLGLLGLVGLE